MSMIGTYLRIEPALLELLRQDPDEIEEVLYGTLKQPADRALDIDKSWHAIHFLLTGKAWEGPLPLRNVVLGGTLLGSLDLGYGPARYLTPDEVRDCAAALSAISSDDLAARFDLAALSKAQIYPQAWRNHNDELEYILDYYRQLVAFFTQAAGAGDAMLTYIC